MSALRSSASIKAGIAGGSRRYATPRPCLGARGRDTLRVMAAFPTLPQPESDKSGTAAANMSAPKGLAHLWPQVSWSRYHLQVLFVDKTDTVRARLAAGLFERCAEWNGYGRALYPWTAGLNVGAKPDIHSISKLTALMRGATSLEILPRYFTRPPEAFELADLDRYDLVMALDSQVHEAIREQICEENEAGPDRDYYLQRLCLLTTFSHYESEAVLTRRGGFALLPAQLSILLKMGAGGLKASKAVVDIHSPDLASPSGAEQWEATVAALILSTASLVKYCIDAIPENLPHYDPVD